MSFLNQKGGAKSSTAASDDTGLTGTGIGESVNFLNEKNHIFINKLNYICKNYDQSFKDVSGFPWATPKPLFGHPRLKPPFFVSDRLTE